MVARRIDIHPESETALIIQEAQSEPVVLVLNGKRFRLEAEHPSQDDVTDEELWTSYNPDRVLEGLHAAAGSWKDVDGERLKEDIYRWRREGSRPFEKP
jgi:hypothetical protein